MRRIRKYLFHEFINSVKFTLSFKVGGGGDMKASGLKFSWLGQGTGLQRKGHSSCLCRHYSAPFQSTVYPAGCRQCKPFSCRSILFFSAERKAENKSALGQKANNDVSNTINQALSCLLSISFQLPRIINTILLSDILDQNDFHTVPGNFSIEY